MISGTAYDQLAGKLDIGFEYMGEQRLKNIARPVRAYRMQSAGAPEASPRDARFDKPSIAVMPFGYRRDQGNFKKHFAIWKRKLQLEIRR